MNQLRGNRITTSLAIAVATLTLLAGATTAGAQDREGHWDFTIGTFYQLGIDVSGKGGSTMSTDNDFGLAATVGYNVTDALETSFGFQWASVGYDADIIEDDGGMVGISGSYDAWAVSANVVYNLIEGPVTPFIGAGIGWTWIDTNIPDGLPSTGCWWDPWWGYICYTTYPTKTTDAFSYQAAVGLRYDINYSTFLRLSYVSQWTEIGKVKDTPRFDVFGLAVGWIF